MVLRGAYHCSHYLAKTAKKKLKNPDQITCFPRVDGKWNLLRPVEM
jgi:hypothetical protein